MATDLATSVACSVAEPVPFMRMHSLFGETMMPLIKVVSELPRNRAEAWSLASLLELACGWIAVKLATLSFERGVSASLPLLFDLEERVTGCRALSQDDILEGTLGAGIEVEAVVVSAGRDIVLEVDRAAERTRRRRPSCCGSG